MYDKIPDGEKLKMYFEDFEIMSEFDIPPVTITKEKILSFAREYDPLPLHMDEKYAEKTNFQRLIAPGVMSFMSVWAEFVKMNVWGDNIIAGKSTKIEWFSPVYADDVLTGKVTVTGRERRNEYNGTVVFTVDIYNQNGDHVIRDVTESVIAAR